MKKELYMIDIGRTFEKLVKEKGIMRMTVAERLGVSVVRVSQIYHSKDRVNFVTIQKMAEILDIQPSTLIKKAEQDNQ